MDGRVINRYSIVFALHGAFLRFCNGALIIISAYTESFKRFLSPALATFVLQWQE